MINQIPAECSYLYSGRTTPVVFPRFLPTFSSQSVTRHVRSVAPGPRPVPFPFHPGHLRPRHTRSPSSHQPSRPCSSCSGSEPATSAKRSLIGNLSCLLRLRLLSHVSNMHPCFYAFVRIQAGINNQRNMEKLSACFLVSITIFILGHFRRDI